MYSYPSLILLLHIALSLSTAASAAQSEFRYGVYNNAPKIFKDDRGQPAGIFPDLLNDIAAKQRWSLKPVFCEWSQCLHLLERGEIDLMPDVAVSPVRASVFAFHQEPMLHSWSRIYGSQDTQLDSLLDLEGKKVAALRDSVQFAYLRELRSGLGIPFELVEVAEIDDGFQLVIQGAVNAVATNHHYGDLQADKFGLTKTAIILQPAALYLAATQQRDMRSALNLIDQALVRWKADDDSYYYQILKKWSDGGYVEYRLPQVAVWGITGTLIALVVAVMFSLLLRRQVKNVTDDLQNSRDELNTILDSVGAHVYIKDNELRYLYANKQLLELFRKSLDDVKGRTDSDFFEAATAQKIVENDHWVLSRGERLVAEEYSTLLGSVGSNVFLSVKIPLRDTSGEIYGLCGISTDLTQNKQIQDEMQALAYYDALTHLPNRRLLMDRLEQSLSTFQRNHHNGALVVVDVDSFSVVNNTLGHEAGDRVLKQVAQRLLSAVRNEDTIARTSSDEFAVLLHDLSKNRDEAAQQTQVVLKKLREAFEDSYQINSNSQVVTASMGVAFFTDSSGNPDEIFRLADIALHQAKAEGPGSLRFFNHGMQVKAKQRADLESDLRLALVREEFFLQYQPQVGSGGAVIGAEALVRWNHPDKGIVPPGVFIDIAESSSLIIPLGHWILEEACGQIAAWEKHTPLSSITVSVNVSAKQFMQEGFVEEVLEVVKQSGANPNRLELEITESILVSDMSTVDSKMSRLAHHGIRFALDDFGTGYSSLNYLKRLPLNKLKIDKSFIDELTSDAHSKAIVNTIVSLAQNLNMSVIAEGVETQEQLTALRSLGDIEIQGYFYSKPLSDVEFESWIERYMSERT